MTYLISIRTSQGDYLICDRNEKRIIAFETQEKALAMFSHYHKAIWSDNYERHASAGISINFARPYILEMRDGADTLSAYFISRAMSQITGSGCNYVGVPINSALIDTFQVCDVASFLLAEPNLQFAE